MDKHEALAFAERIRRYVEVDSDHEAVEISDAIIGDFADFIARCAKRDGWYSELAEAMGWAD